MDAGRHPDPLPGQVCLRKTQRTDPDGIGQLQGRLLRRQHGQQPLPRRHRVHLRINPHDEKRDCLCSTIFIPMPAGRYPGSGYPACRSPRAAAGGGFRPRTISRPGGHRRRRPRRSDDRNGRGSWNGNNHAACHDRNSGNGIGNTGRPAPERSALFRHIAQTAREKEERQADASGTVGRFGPHAQKAAGPDQFLQHLRTAGPMGRGHQRLFLDSLEQRLHGSS